MGSDLVPVGRVGKPHGLDGGFFVEGASEREDVFAKGAMLFAAGEPATVVASRRGSGGRPVIVLDRAVERGAELSVARATLPNLDDEDEPGAYWLLDLVQRRTPYNGAALTTSREDAVAEFTERGL